MHIVRPAEILRDFIESYYLAEFIGSQNTEEFVHKPISDGCVEMFIGYDDTNNTCYTNNGDSARVKAGIVGVHDLKNALKGMVMEADQKTCKFVSIKFKPSGFYNIFKTPPSELYNTFVDPYFVIGAELNQLREELTEAKDYTERTKLLDFFFTKHLSQNGHKDYRINAGFNIANLIRHCKGNIKIGQLVNEFKVTERTLQRDLKSAIGLSPKEYCKIIRTNSLLNYISQYQIVNWFDMVSLFGYYDQAHLINEFKTATGLTPCIYLQHHNKSVFKIDNHLVILKPNVLYCEVTYALAEGAINSSNYHQEKLNIN